MRYESLLYSKPDFAQCLNFKTSSYHIPKSALKAPCPAILCNHGHGKFAKDSVMGVRSGNARERNAEIEAFNYDYCLQMAKRGYVTMAID
jgi:hypothetical protein